jgi:hypothetical protein
LGLQDSQDDGPRFHITADRGYTAAEKKHGNNSLDVSDLAATGLSRSITGDSLNQSIRSSLQLYGGSADTGNSRWLPVDKLFKLVNESRVYEELSRAFGEKLNRGEITETKLRHYAQKICGHVTYTDSDGHALKSSCRSIFAILALMGEIQDAPDFVNAGLSDKDLPLYWRSNPTTGTPEFCSNVRSGEIWTVKTWAVGQNWRDSTFDLFLGYQKQMLSPYFELWTGKVSFYDLDHDAILPFIEDCQNSRQRQGYHGSVWRVKIHPAHYDAYGVLPPIFTNAIY